MDFLFATAYANEATATQNPMMSFVPFIVIFAIFYFLVIRPQKGKIEQEQKMLQSLSKGDEIYTKAGIIGTIHGLTDKVVTLEVENGVKFKILRSQIGGLAKTIFEPAETKKA
jgi:preprotein translocase subunit YajC